MPGHPQQCAHGRKDLNGAYKIQHHPPPPRPLGRNAYTTCNASMNDEHAMGFGLNAQSQLASAKRSGMLSQLAPITSPGNLLGMQSQAMKNADTVPKCADATDIYHV